VVHHTRLEKRVKGKGKGKVHPRTGHEGPEGEQRYISTLSLTSALDGGEWSTPHPAHFTTGKDPVYGLGGPQDRSGWVQKISPHPTPTGLDPRTVQPIVSHYTD
jgi:hypothetical protein